MLEKIDHFGSMDLRTYKQQMKELEKKFVGLQESIKDYEIPVVLAFEGWSASGKGTLISRVLYPLDPRFFNVHTMGKVTEDQFMRPFLWAFWINTPAKGRISIFDKSWCRTILPGAKQRQLKPKERDEFYYDVKAFEEQLINSGVVLLKFFLHISKDEQQARFKALEKHPDIAWRVDAHDREQNKNYNAYLKLFSEMLNKTNYNNSRWNVVEANDTKFATVLIYNIVIKSLEEEIARRAKATPEQAPTQLFARKPGLLSKIDVSKSIADKDYKSRLDVLQKKIAVQGFKMYTRRRSVVIVYEGWDAAGKGGNIKRLTEHLDPRAYEVVPIGKPTEEELSHHYLWRFYTRMPKDGHMSIFDRSWYGRVMVERVERLAEPEQWARAFDEINDMERHLVNHGVIIFKFWLHIDPAEQLARFEARQRDPLKSYKITDEDWRNREKWDQYEASVDDMLAQTNTDFAPWTIIESNDKKYARIKTLEIVTGGLDKLL
ncbi:MAG: polyphosphate:AMP phosphotransferase [Clostridiales bacterium]|jgi:polyphosphate:AMP phosphotransferase|nr:polyphosphate:AMP phosphotransferase [Clostridiales bacterium]